MAENSESSPTTAVRCCGRPCRCAAPRQRRRPFAVTLLVASLIAVMLSACQTIETKTTPSNAGSAAVEPEARDDLPGLIRYTSWIRHQPMARLVAIRPRMEKLAHDTDSSVFRIRLAILLSVSDAPFRDEARARTLLNQIIARNDPGHRDLVAFAKVLLWNLDDRASARETCENDLKNERSQRQNLQHKLDELKAIEEQLDQRDVKH